MGRVTTAQRGCPWAFGALFGNGHRHLRREGAEGWLSILPAFPESINPLTALCWAFSVSLQSSDQAGCKRRKKTFQGDLIPSDPKFYLCFVVFKVKTMGLEFSLHALPTKAIRCRARFLASRPVILPVLFCSRMPQTQTRTAVVGGGGKRHRVLRPGLLFFPGPLSIPRAQSVILVC